MKPKTGRPPTVNATRSLNLRITDEQHAKLTKLGKQRKHSSVSETVRDLIKRAKLK